MAPGIGSLFIASLAVLQTVQGTHLRSSLAHFADSGRAHATEFVQHHLPGVDADYQEDMKVGSVNMSSTTADDAEVFNAEGVFDIQQPIEEAVHASKSDVPSKVLDIVHSMQTREGHDVSEVKQQLIDILDTAIANMQSETNLDAAGVEDLHQMIGKCESSHAPGNVGTASRDSFQQFRSEHLQCRIAEGALKQNSETCAADLALMQATKDAKCNIPALDEAVDTQSCLTKDSSETKERYLDRLRQHFVDKASEYTSSKQVCDTATTALTAKSGECIGTQNRMAKTSMECIERQMQVSSEACGWATEVQANCQAYDECHSMAAGPYQEAKTRAAEAIRLREKSRKGMEFMKCVVTSIKASGDGVDDAIFNDCKSNTFAAGTLSRAFPVLESKMICSAPTVYPCSAEYLVDIQRGVPANVQLSDCSDAPCHAISTTTTTTTTWTTTTISTAAPQKDPTPAAIFLLKDAPVCKDSPAAQGLTQSECAALHGQTVKTNDGLTEVTVNWKSAGSWGSASNPEACGCYVNDANNVYYNAHPDPCTGKDPGEILICKQAGATTSEGDESTAGKEPSAPEVEVPVLWTTLHSSSALTDGGIEQTGGSWGSCFATTDATVTKVTWKFGQGGEPIFGMCCDSGCTDSGALYNHVCYFGVYMAHGGVPNRLYLKDGGKSRYFPFAPETTPDWKNDEWSLRQNGDGHVEYLRNGEIFYTSEGKPASPMQLRFDAGARGIDGDGNIAYVRAFG